MKTLGEIIKSYRLTKGIKQDEISLLLNLNQSTYSRIENDKIEPSIKVLYKISKILNFNIDHILEILYKKENPKIESSNLKRKLN